MRPDKTDAKPLNASHDILCSIVSFCVDEENVTLCNNNKDDNDANMKWMVTESLAVRISNRFVKCVWLCFVDIIQHCCAKVRHTDSKDAYITHNNET